MNEQLGYSSDDDEPLSCFMLSRKKKKTRYQPLEYKLNATRNADSEQCDTESSPLKSDSKGYKKKTGYKKYDDVVRKMGLCNLGSNAEYEEDLLLQEYSHDGVAYYSSDDGVLGDADDFADDALLLPTRSKHKKDRYADLDPRNLKSYFNVSASHSKQFRDAVGSNVPNTKPFKPDILSALSGLNYPSFNWSTAPLKRCTTTSRLNLGCTLRDDKDFYKPSSPEPGPSAKKDIFQNLKKRSSAAEPGPSGKKDDFQKKSAATDTNTSVLKYKKKSHPPTYIPTSTYTRDPIPPAKTRGLRDSSVRKLQESDLWTAERPSETFPKVNTRGRLSNEERDSIWYEVTFPTKKQTFSPVPRYDTSSLRKIIDDIYFDDDDIYQLPPPPRPPPYKPDVANCIRQPKSTGRTRKGGDNSVKSRLFNTDTNLISSTTVSKHAEASGTKAKSPESAAGKRTSYNPYNVPLPIYRPGFSCFKPHPHPRPSIATITGNDSTPAKSTPPVHLLKWLTSSRKESDQTEIERRMTSVHARQNDYQSLPQRK